MMEMDSIRPRGRLTGNGCDIPSRARRLLGVYGILGWTAVSLGPLL